MGWLIPAHLQKLVTHRERPKLAIWTFAVISTTLTARLTLTATLAHIYLTFPAPWGISQPLQSTDSLPNRQMILKVWFMVVASCTVFWNN